MLQLPHIGINMHKNIEWLFPVLCRSYRAVHHGCLTKSHPNNINNKRLTHSQAAY